MGEETDWREQVLFTIGPRICDDVFRYEALKQCLDKVTAHDSQDPNEVLNQVKLLLKTIPFFYDDVLFLIKRGLRIIPNDTPNPYLVEKPSGQSQDILNLNIDISSLIEPFSSTIALVNQDDEDDIDLYSLVKTRRKLWEEAFHRRNSLLITEHRSKCRRRSFSFFNSSKSKPVQISNKNGLKKQSATSSSSSSPREDVLREEALEITLQSTMSFPISRVDRIPRHITNIPSSHVHIQDDDEPLLNYIPLVRDVSQFDVLRQVVSLSDEYPLFSCEAGEELVQELTFEIVSHFGPTDFVLTVLAKEFQLPNRLIKSACKTRALRNVPLNTNKDSYLKVRTASEQEDLLINYRYFFCSQCKLFMCRCHELNRPPKYERLFPPQPAEPQQPINGTHFPVERPLVVNGHSLKTNGIDVKVNEEEDVSTDQLEREMISRQSNGIPNNEVPLDQTEAILVEHCHRVFPNNPSHAEVLFKCLTGKGDLEFVEESQRRAQRDLTDAEVRSRTMPSVKDGPQQDHHRIVLPRKLRFPCSHPGPCIAPECTCAAAKRYCESDCGCNSLTCCNMFQGCSCRPSSSSSSSNGVVGSCCSFGKDCRCRYYGKECVEGRCPCASSIACANMNITQAKPAPKLVVGVSEVHFNGVGLYAGEDIQRGTFIAEYVGEVLTSEEANARGYIYDNIVNISFLFQLCAGRDVDAVRRGNQTKWINCAPNRRILDEETASSSSSSSARSLSDSFESDIELEVDDEEEEGEEYVQKKSGDVEIVGSSFGSHSVMNSASKSRHSALRTRKMRKQWRSGGTPIIKRPAKRIWKEGEQKKKRRKRRRKGTTRTIGGGKGGGSKTSLIGKQATPPLMMQKSIDMLLKERRDIAKRGLPIHANVLSRIIFVNGEPRISFFAKRFIRKGEELCFDYGKFIKLF